MYLLLTVTMRLTNIPGMVLAFAKMYIQCNVMQFMLIHCSLFLVLILNNAQYMSLKN